MNGHDPDDRGDDADGTDDDPEDSPDGWPDDWTAASDDPLNSQDDADPDDEPADPHAGGDAADDPVDPHAAGDAADEPADPHARGDADPADPVADEVDAGDGVAVNDPGTAGATTRADEGAPTDGTESTLGERSTVEKPPAPGVDDEPPTISDDGLLTWFLNSPNGWVVFVRDVVSSVAAVAAIGLLLFAISGIWPPLVAVESGSMEPHMSKGDLVFIVDEDRFAPRSSVADTGVATYESATAADGYSKFGSYGDVIVYRPNGANAATPIIHRARFYVEEDENWVASANPEYLGGIDSCNDLPDDICPAPRDGFITKGDANDRYDQIAGQSNVVAESWIRGKAQVRVPLLGWIRLQFAKLTTAGTSPVVPTMPADGVALFARLGALGAAAGAAVVATRT